MWIFFQIHTYFPKCLPVLLINFSPFPLQICLWGKALFSKQPWAVQPLFSSAAEKCCDSFAAITEPRWEAGPSTAGSAVLRPNCLWSSPFGWQDAPCIVFVRDLTILLPWVASRQNPASFAPTLLLRSVCTYLCFSFTFAIRVTLQSTAHCISHQREE